MKTIVLSVLTTLVLAVSGNAFALTTNVDVETDESYEMGIDEYNDYAHGEQRWSCQANNARRSGPYDGEGPTQFDAQRAALAKCRSATIVRCWIVPRSCYARW